MTIISFIFLHNPVISSPLIACWDINIKLFIYTSKYSIYPACIILLIKTSIFLSVLLISIENPGLFLDFNILRFDTFDLVSYKYIISCNLLFASSNVTLNDVANECIILSLGICKFIKSIK